MDMNLIIINGLDVCSTVSSMLSGLGTSSLGLSTLGM